MLYDKKSIASIMNQYFSSVTTKLVQKLKAGKTIFVGSDLSNISTSSITLFCFMPVSEQFVLNELKRLKTNKAIGLDHISARLLKDMIFLLKIISSKMFKQLRDDG